jgi:hypothetical protein
MAMASLAGGEGRWLATAKLPEGAEKQREL